MPRKKKEEQVKPPEAVETAQPEPISSPIVPEEGRLLRKLTVERRQDSSAPSATKLPRVIGGICEFCGVLDSTVPSHLQYKLCKHYDGLDLRCTYCSPGTRFDTPGADGFIGNRQYSIFEFPINSGNLVVVCDDIKCSDKHFARFNKGNR